MNGLALSTVLAGCAVVGLIAFKRATVSSALTNYSWGALVAAAALGVWIVVRATADIRSFELMLQ